MLEDAATWYARLREPENDPALAAARQADFDRWLAADRRHRQAFESVEQLWHKLEQPVAQVMAQTPVPFDKARRAHRPVGKRLLSPVGLAACLAVFVGVGVFFQDEIALRLNSDYRTAVGQRLPLSLADGSRVILNTDSAIAVDLKPNRRTIRLLQGEVWFDVMSDRDRPLFVETTDGQVRVTGTRFGVRSRGDATTVSLAHGRVELLAAGEDGSVSPVALSSGQQARLSPTGVSDPNGFDQTAVTAWLRGQLVFYHASLPAVIAELNRYRSGHIFIADNDLDALKISGVFTTDDPDAALSAITATLPVQVIRLTDYLVLLR